MRLLVLGDFRGSAAAERPPLPGRPTQQVDLDTFDDVMRRLAPSLHGPAGQIGFSQIDDFHPDRLYARLDLFQALREKRANPPADLDDLFGRLLGKPPQSTATPASAPAAALDALIHKIIAPHIVRDTSAQTQAYVAAVDAAIAEQMRALLHDAAFQSLEAAWRGVHWLISRLELDENLQLHLFDVSREELARAMSSRHRASSLKPGSIAPSSIAGATSPAVRGGPPSPASAASDRRTRTSASWLPSG